MTSVLRLGIVGCGGAALDVARAAGAVDSVSVSGVHDLDRRRAERIARQVGGRVHEELGGLLDDPSVDAVYIALPHDLLAPTAVAALSAGRHVLVEKPVATSIEQLAGLRSAAEAASRRVGVMFQLRFAPAVAAAARLVRQGGIGTPRLIRIRTLIDKPATYWDGGPTGLVRDRWRASRERAGGGVVMMNTIHQLDAVRAITGLDVERVTGEIATSVPGVDVEDVGVAALRFHGGALGSIVASAHATGATHGETIEIEAHRGTLRIPDLYVDEAPLDINVVRPFGAIPADRWTTISPVPANPWAEALSAFAQSVGAGREPVPGLDDAEAALATVLALYESAATGRSVRL